MLLMIPVNYKWMRFRQDTTRIIGKETVHRKDSVQHSKDSGLHKITNPLSLDSIESILSQGERRIKKIDSVNLRKKHLRIAAARKEKPTVKTNLPDTTQLLTRLNSFQETRRSDMLDRMASSTPSLPKDSFMIYRPFGKKTVSFQGTSAPYTSHEPVVIERESAYLRENWFLGVLSLSFILIIWTKIRFGKLLNETLTGMWNYKNAFSLFRNRSSLYQQTSFLLFLNYLLSGGLFMYLSLKTFQVEVFNRGDAPLLIYSLILVGLAGLYVYLYVVIRLTGFFSLSREVMSEFSHFTILFFHNTGVYLFPFNVLIPYINKEVAPWLIYTGFLLIAGLYVLRMVKVIILFMKERFSLFFLFLYLCALEILPVLIFLHLIFR